MPHDQALSFFAGYIERELGIVYAEHNFFQLQNRLTEIAKLLGIATIEDLYNQAKVGIAGQFRQLLLDVATNNETSFFRDPKVFRAIENVILPELAAKSICLPRVHVWSAASSSGQEALSVAMLVLEWSQKQAKKLDLKIVGTDISERILAKASSARYTQLEVQRGLPAALMIKYFSKETGPAAATGNDHWNANPELTRHIKYHRQNLTEEFRFDQAFDLILCRNVLIYQNVERKREILKRVHAALAPGGFLVLGSGESLLGLSAEFESVPADSAVLYRKPLAAAGVSNV